MSTDKKVFAYKVHLDFVKKDNSRIKMGTFITYDGLKTPKIVDMMFNSLKKQFIEEVVEKCKQLK